MTAFKKGSIVAFTYTKDDGSESDRVVQLSEDYSQSPSGLQGKPRFSDHYRTLEGVDLINGGYKQFKWRGISELTQVEEKQEPMSEWVYHTIFLDSLPNEVIHSEYSNGVFRTYWRVSQSRFEVGDNLLRVTDERGVSSDFVLSNGEIRMGGALLGDFQTFIANLEQAYYGE